MDRLSIKGASNIAKLVEAVSNNEVQILITLDDYQAQKDPEERYYTVDIIDPRSGEGFERIEEA